MRPTLASPYHAGNLLICNQLIGVVIATAVPLVAIPEQIRCKRGHVPCTVARGTADEDKR